MDVGGPGLRGGEWGGGEPHGDAEDGGGCGGGGVFGDVDECVADGPAAADAEGDAVARERELGGGRG